MVSIATALALPLALVDGKPFTARHLIIFLSFVVIFITLVVQGLSLHLLIRWLKIEKTEDPGKETKELHLLMLRRTILFIEHDNPAIDETIKQKLVSKYGNEIMRLTEAITLNTDIT